MTPWSSPFRIPEWARCCCCHRRVPMPARLFRERSVTILVGLVRRSFNRLRRSLFFSDSADSSILHRRESELTIVREFACLTKRKLTSKVVVFKSCYSQQGAFCYDT